MNYYSLCHGEKEGRFTDGDVKFEPCLDGYYQIGKNISFSGISVSVTMEKSVKKLESDFFLVFRGAFFVSEEMKCVLEDCNVELVFISADVKYFNGKAVEKKYFFIHANREIPCFDYERSEYSGKAMILSRIRAGELAPDYKARGIKVFCVDESKAESLDFMFVAGVIWLDPIISEVLAEKIKKERLLARVDVIG